MAIARVKMVAILNTVIGLSLIHIQMCIRDRMCSPRELHLPNAPQKRGIIELDDAEVAGTPFDPARHWHE